MTVLTYLNVSQPADRHRHPWRPQWSRALVSVFTLTLCGAVCLTSTGNAGAQSGIPPAPPAAWLDECGDTSSDTCVGMRIKDVYIPRAGGRFHVNVLRDKLTVALFPGWVKFDGGAHSYNGFQIEPHRNTVTLMALEELPVGTEANMVLTAGDFMASMDIVVTDKPSEHQVIRVIPVSQEEYDQRMADDDEARKARARQRDEAARRADRRDMASVLLRLRELRARHSHVAHTGNGVESEIPRARPGQMRASLGWAISIDRDRYMVVTVDNQSDQAVELVSAGIALPGEYEADPVDVVWDARPVEQTSIVIEPKHHARGMIVIPESVSGSLRDLGVYLVGADGKTAMIAKQIIELWPLPEDQRKRERMAKQTTISVRGLFGGFWTTDAAGQDRIDGTIMTGFGVRVQKGFNHNLAFEGELIGGRSGRANFAAMTWNGTTGDVVRQASLGRLSASGVIRFGDRFIISTRLGVGIQLASYDSTFTTGGELMDGPGDGLEVDGVATVGGGFDVRLGEHVTLGINLAFTQLWRTGSSFLEAGLHLGYGWN